MFQNIIRNYDGDIHSFHPYYKAADRERWDALPEYLKTDLVKAGEQFLDYQYPFISATKYMDFCRIGNRSNFEELYFNRRRVLNTLVLAECVENQGRFMDDIVNGVVAICEESGWQLPSHNTYPEAVEVKRNTVGGHQCLPDYNDPVMDLFSCETAAQLAVVAYLLKEKLDAIHPCIVTRIYQEIKTRTLYPYFKHHFWWMGDTDHEVNNWTPWCTQNILIALLSIEEIDQETRKNIVDQCARSLDCFVDSYGEDGCCNEGAGYYHAAGLALFGAMQVLNAVTDDCIESLYMNTKIYNIAAYIMNVHVDDCYYANFSDCSIRAGRAGVREFLFAKATGNKDMMAFAAMDHKKDTEYLLPRAENLYYRLQAAFIEKEISEYEGTKIIEKPDIYYESVGLLITRDKNYYLAVKAGCNDDSHNHNDTGSITIYKDGKPMLIDVGVETYCKKTFSENRYEIWTMQSAYHNVITFGDTMQLPGPDYKAKVETVTMKLDKVEMIMELASAYPKGTVGSYKRKVEFYKNEKIIITDTLDTVPEGTFLTLMTLGKPEYRENQLNIMGSGSIKIYNEPNVKIEPIKLTDPKLRKEWGEEIYRTKLYLTGKQVRIEIV